ncbi:MAG TPA: DNA-binding response regulator, partial [Mycobacterium sp.]
VRNVGYKAVRPTRGRPPTSEPADDDDESDSGNYQEPLADPLHSQ